MPVLDVGEEVITEEEVVVEVEMVDIMVEAEVVDMMIGERGQGNILMGHLTESEKWTLDHPREGMVLPLLNLSLTCLVVLKSAGKEV